MKLLRVLELLSATLPLVFLLNLSSSNKVAALTKYVNDIDFYNASSAHVGGCGVTLDLDENSSRVTNSTTRVLNNMNGTAHSRGKRFIAFPVGSSFSTAVCLTTGVVGNPDYRYLSMGLNWGIAYELPNTTWVLQHANGFGPKHKEKVASPQIKRRHRRDLYGKLETLINGMGYNGRDCILRALCESRQYFQKTKMGMIGEMLRVIFSLPKQRLFTRELSENPDIGLYDGAYRKARSISDCSEQYDCDFSLLELAFGKYSTPPIGYYTKH